MAQVESIDADAKERILFMPSFFNGILHPQFVTKSSKGEYRLKAQLSQHVKNKSPEVQFRITYRSETPPDKKFFSSLDTKFNYGIQIYSHWHINIVQGMAATNGDANILSSSSMEEFVSIIFNQLSVKPEQLAVADASLASYLDSIGYKLLRSIDSIEEDPKVCSVLSAKVYSANENWKRHRVLGFQCNAGDIETEANLLFTPLKQRNPASEDPYAADFNTIDNYCELPNPWFYFNMLSGDFAKLGNRIKYLIECQKRLTFQNQSNSHQRSDLFINKSDSLRLFEREPGNHDILEIQEINNRFIILGGIVGDPSILPTNFPVVETKSVFTGKKILCARDVTLPLDISDEILGKLLSGIWVAKKHLKYSIVE